MVSCLQTCLAASATLLAMWPAPAASAQSSILDRTRTTRGFVGDTTLTLAANDAADRAGVFCEVADVALRDEDRITSSRHYEVSCRDGAGFLIVSTPESDRAYDCLMLAASAEVIRRRDPTDPRRPVVCTLPANADGLRRYAAMARTGGIACRVDGGALVGRGPSGGLIYEIGCRGEAGAWIETTPDGPVVTGCVDVLALGGRCELTDAEEEAAALSGWVDASTCRPLSARSLGRTATGMAWFEVACRDAGPVVVGRDDRGRTVEVLTCDEAAQRLEPCEGL